jgi:hypothetical protein
MWSLRSSLPEHADAVLLECSVKQVRQPGASQGYLLLSHLADIGLVFRRDVDGPLVFSIGDA